MISLTVQGAAQIKVLEGQQTDASKRLRVFVESGGCSGFQYGMSFDVQKDGDHVCESEGVSFLVDATSYAYLDESVIDFDDGLHGKGFEIRNPNAQSTCGCGKSFN
jgi:iron-sulfur cluster assembly protein/iron-sulfur cluster insertion protein